eukprot:TRINITY_DN77597_c0_g1_i2.p1 TRINITY_DN77597_c0_g1~~TRINITY_DN77597_c0_g1_i2.p1  ORF type:complete len:197 (+),score=16.64 TRINITY_DN77597_c0_g1_i2:111-701(+)
MSANLQQQRLRRQRDCALKGDRYGSCSEAKDATVPEASTQLPRIGSRSLYSEEELHYTLNLLCQRQDRLGGQLSMLHREVQELRVLMTSMLQDIQLRLDSLVRCNELDQHFLHGRPRDVYSHDIAYCSPLNPFDPESHTRIRTTREGYHGYGWYGKEVSCGDQHDVEDDEDGDRVSFSTDDNDDDDSQDAANHNDG